MDGLAEGKNWLTVAVVALAAGAALAPAYGASPARGEQRQWSLDFRVRLEQPGAGRPAAIQLTGDWTSTIVATRTGEYDAQLELLQPHIAGEGLPVPDSAATRQLEARMSGGFWVTYRNDGTLVAAYFFRETPATDRNLLLMIATELQFVAFQADRWTWNALERDAGGEYLAVYQRTGPGSVTKRKLKYVQADGAAGARPGALQIDVEESELRFSFDADGGIASVEGGSRLGAGGAAAVQVKSVTQTRLAGLRSGFAPERIGSLSRAGDRVSATAIVTNSSTSQSSRDEKDRKLIEGMSSDSALRTALEQQRDAQTSERLAALFRFRPETIGTALNLLRKHGSGRVITDALALAGSLPATDALGRLARDRSVARTLRIDALSALQLTEEPRTEAMQIPVALIYDEDVVVASTARLVSGSLAHAGRRGHAEASDAIDEALAAAYWTTTVEEERCGLLAAMGNSSGPRLGPVIEAAGEDEREAIRAAAVRAVRLVDGQEADARIAAAIVSDAAPGVRAAAILAAGFRHPLPGVIAEALVTAAREDKTEYVRSGAISLLRQNPEASVRTREALAWIAEHDLKDGVRRLARDALASLTGRR